MKELLRETVTLRRIEYLDGSDLIYSFAFRDAMAGGCLTSGKVCIDDHLMWARICGCHHSPYDVEKQDAPKCGCVGKLEPSKLEVRETHPGEANIAAFLSLEPHRKDKLTWHLVMTPRGWRIDDVATTDYPSLKAYMLRRLGPA